MTNIKYRLLNVFAETTFGGNLLAVIEDGSGLTIPVTASFYE